MASANDSRRPIVALFVALIAIDVALIAINVFGAPSFLNLDEERNFSTWYSSAKLLATAFAALWCMTLEAAPERKGLRALVWPAVALVFAGLSMDETATAHERLAAAFMSSAEGDSLRARILGGDAAKDAFAWPVLFAPVILALVYFLANALWSRMKVHRAAFFLGLTGLAAFLVAIALEGSVVYFSPPIDAWSDADVNRYTLATLIEESAEVFGTTAMLASLVLHAVRLRSGPD